MLRLRPFFAALLLSFVPACTTYHSKQALSASTPEPPPSHATFVTEEDSGLMLLSLFTITEPDHYAVLMERVHRRHRCTTIRLAQLDFYTDSWVVVAFPIARITLVCEHAPTPAGPAVQEPPP